MPLNIHSEPDDLQEGLFGQVILYIFETLPYFYENNIYPSWDICAKLYGYNSRNLVIPGAFDLAYQIPRNAMMDLSIDCVREEKCYVLGSNWCKLSEIWHTYFSIPKRIQASTSLLGDMTKTLGIHYRGNDKQYSTWDTNPVSPTDFLAVINDFLTNNHHLDINRIFLASDDVDFHSFLKSNTKINIVNIGNGGFHKDISSNDSLSKKTDTAIADCYALSKCNTVLCTSSALSAFAKILNKDLSIFRIAASKKFADIPYFPIAYIPPYKSTDYKVQCLLERLMQGDWTKEPNTDIYKTDFAYSIRDSLLLKKSSVIN